MPRDTAEFGAENHIGKNGFQNAARSQAEDIAALTSPEAEQGLLGTILRDNQTFHSVIEIIRPADFGVPVHGRIFDAISRLIDRGHVADPITLKNVFDQDGSLTEIGGSQYLARLAASAVTLLNADTYASMIKDLALRRAIVVASDELKTNAFRVSPENGPHELIEEFDWRLLEIDGGRERNAPICIGDGIDAALASAEQTYKHGGSLGIQTGLADLDRILGGLQPSDFIVLGGRPSMGKTGAVLSIAHNAARNGYPVLAFSLEMATKQLMARLLAGTGLSAQDQRRGPISPLQMQLLIEEGDRLRSLPLWIDDTGNASVAHMRRHSLRQKRQRGLSLIVVDYLQLVRGYGENRVQEVSSVSRDLKALAKELDVPVLAAAQLSRAVEVRPDKRPLLSDLRDSGTIEQDADVIIFVFREEYYLARAEPLRKAGQSEDEHSKEFDNWAKQLAAVEGIAELIIAKQRQGETGVARARFDAERTRFENLNWGETK
jgi:replicative DNA helicase